ncbi:MAG: hypothetical protein K5912_03205 [Alphaproteobacteria bacterium]|nr:hypothetical protein [Alphaproteobacteria bacterium]
MTITVQECKRLRKKYRDILNEKFSARQDIIFDNTKTCKPSNACIMLDEYEPTEDTDCMIYRDDFVPSYTVHQCYSFDLCQNQQCAYFARYKKYKSLEREAESISKKLDAVPFWIKLASLFVKSPRLIS